MSNKLNLIALAALMLGATGAQADDTDKPMFSFGGFGTVGVVHSSEKNADFQNSVFQPNGAGRARSWSMDVDSKLGVQMTANLTPQLTGVVQLISEQRYDNSYIPLVEWANLKYAFTPDFNVRIGRTVLPAYLVSDSRKVGYTNPWVRPPVSLYSLVPITNADGIDTSYRFRVGPVTNTLQASYGHNIIKINGPENNYANNVWGIYNTTEYGAATFHVAYQRLRLTVPLINHVMDFYRPFGPAGAAVANKFTIDHQPIEFYGMGASYDPGQWFVMSEYGHQKTESFIGEQRAWYVTGGYRIGSLTPYATYAQLRTLSATSNSGLNPATVPPFLTGAVMQLNGLVNALLMSTSENTVSVGLRWDFAKNADLKVQFDRINLGNNSMGTLHNLTPSFQPGGNVNLFSAAVDFLF